MKIIQIFTNHELSFLDDCKKIMINYNEDIDDNDDILEYYYKNK